MPEPLLTQTVIAFIWDFDRTLIAGNMQAPIFEAYDVDQTSSGARSTASSTYHAARSEIVAPDMAYLLHLLTYVRAGRLPGLSNDKLRELGRLLEPVPGMPDFMDEDTRVGAAHPGVSPRGHHRRALCRSRPASVPMIEGSVYAPTLDGIWANTFIEEPAPPGFLDQLPVAGDAGGITQVGYPIDHTTKTRAIFEINKGVNVDPCARRPCADGRIAQASSAAQHDLHRRRCKRRACVLDSQRRRRQDVRRCCRR